VSVGREQVDVPPAGPRDPLVHHDLDLAASSVRGVLGRQRREPPHDGRGDRIRIGLPEVPLRLRHEPEVVGTERDGGDHEPHPARRSTVSSSARTSAATLRRREPPGPFHDDRWRLGEVEDLAVRVVLGGSGGGADVDDQQRPRRAAAGELLLGVEHRRPVVALRRGGDRQRRVVPLGVDDVGRGPDADDGRVPVRAGGPADLATRGPCRMRLGRDVTGAEGAVAGRCGDHPTQARWPGPLITTGT
jgi:hypothetical protein